MEATAFSTDGSEVIHRSIEGSASQVLKAENVKTVYEIPQCVQFINSNNYRKVALQFPDDLLGDASHVVKGIQQETTAKVFILGDTSYGSCCVDEIAAQHSNADCIIHYGGACLSPTSRLPVLYVFGQMPIDVAHCIGEFRHYFPNSDESVLVLYDVVYTHAVEGLERLLQSKHSGVVVSKVNRSPSNIPSQRKEQKPTSPNKNRTEISNTLSSISSLHNSFDGADDDALSQDRTFCHFGRTVKLAHGGHIEDFAVFYIGCESRTLTNLMMTFNKCPFYTYDPKNGMSRKETLNVNRALMKRYYMVEKCKDAGVVGIVAGTLGVSDYLGVIAHLKDVIKKAGKKTYTFVVGKLNVPKLANFMEVDVFVLVSCPENSLIDSQEFYKPVVTPFEMELACNRAREWTGEYITDFRQILPGASKHVPLPTDAGSVETDVSLITGNLRTLGTRDVNPETDCKSLVIRDDMEVSLVHADAGEFLAGRCWRGLEQDLGNTPVTKAVEGRQGIAASYTNELEDGTPID